MARSPCSPTPATRCCSPSVTVDVAPAASAGLPRLTATGAFGLGSASPITVQYPAVTTRNVAAMKLTQGGAAVVGASVQIVGSLASFAATIDGSAATNAIHATATTSATGAIAAATMVPAGSASLVATLASGEVEVVALDLTESGRPGDRRAAERGVGRRRLDRLRGQPAAGRRGRAPARRGARARRRAAGRGGDRQRRQLRGVARRRRQLRRPVARLRGARRVRGARRPAAARR